MEAQRDQFGDISFAHTHARVCSTPSSGPTWLSGSDMILAIILLARSGVSGLNGRRRTRDWSGRRIVPVRWTFVEAVIMDWQFLRIVTESCDY
jgi:hypothetical protein